MCRRLDDPDRVPVGIELIREHHRQAGVGALAHFGMGHDGGYSVVGAYFYPCRNNGFMFGAYQPGYSRVSIAGTNRHTNHECATGDNASANEGPPAPFTHQPVSFCRSAAMAAAARFIPR